MRHVTRDTWQGYTLVIVIRRNYNVDPRQHVPRPAGLVMDEDELDKYTAPAQAAAQYPGAGGATQRVFAVDNR